MLNLQTGVFTQGSVAQLAALLGQVLGVTGNVYYVDPKNGSDTWDGSQGLNVFGTSVGPLRTLAAGYARLASGQNDVLVLISDGTTSSTARLSATFTWAKNAAHLVGMCAPGILSQRARIAPTAGVAAFADFFKVTGNGCYFQNIQWFQGFTTGVAAQIALAVSGGRNVFRNCHAAGMGDNESAQDTGSRSLKISSTGENLFEDCAIGIDTIVRTVANASIEFALGTPRNLFRRCILPFDGNSADVLGVVVAGAAGIDRFNMFEQCSFLNAIKSGSTAMTGLAKLAASAGGMLVFRDCMMVGVSSLGYDAGSKTQIYEYGAANSTSAFIGANPA